MRLIILTTRLVPVAAACVVFATITGIARAVGENGEANPPYSIVAFHDVMIPVRDGVRLATDIYLPARNGAAVPGRYPTIVTRTPYDKTITFAQPVSFWVGKGYAVVSQNVRGRYRSEGRWTMLSDDGRDGADLLKWIGEQSWSNGKVGTVGTSYAGGTQHAMAIANAPNLTAMVPVDALSDAGRLGIRHQGAFELRFLPWIFSLGLDTTSQSAVRAADTPEAVQSLLEMRNHSYEYMDALPIRAGTTPLKFAPDYESWLIEAMSHGDNDAFWTDMGADVIGHVAEYKDVPVYHVTGWYDSWGAQVANLNYPALTKSKKSLQRLIVGPWTHGAQEVSHAGMADFGDAAAVNMNELRLQWFDRWLKGIDNGVDREPPVRIFVMGGGDAHKTAEGRVYVGGHWRNEKAWPLARAVDTPFYLHADGSLSTEVPGDSKPTRYRFDPHNPVPTLGGNISSGGSRMEPGALDQKCRKEFELCRDTLPLSARNDVVVFQSTPLGDDMEVTGPVTVKLWASSDSLDTDFTAKLIDVYPPNRDFPSGIDLNVGDGIVRARYRDSLRKATLLKPGQAYEFTIEFYPTSLLVKRGHRIRVDVSSSNYPRFDINPNTGEPLNANRSWRVAENSIYHDRAHPSRIVLPVVPRTDAAKNLH